MAREYGSIQELLDDFDQGLLGKGFNPYKGPNVEQNRFMSALSDRYGIGDDVQIYLAIHKLVSAVVEEVEGGSGR